MKKILSSFLICFMATLGLFFGNIGNAKGEQMAVAAATEDALVMSAFNDNENLAGLISDGSPLASEFNVLNTVKHETYDQNPFGTCYAMSLAQLLNLTYEYRYGEHIRVSAAALAVQIKDLFFDEGSNDYQILSQSFDLDYVSEFDYPYELINEYYKNLGSTTDVVDIDFSEDEIFDVKEYYLFPYVEDLKNSSSTVKQTYITAVKRAIVRDGALGIGMPWAVASYNGDIVYDKYASYSGYHAVTLVGYDDNYAGKYNSTGAFILLNSWGVGEDNSMQEIVYLSYSDIFAFDFVYGVADFIAADETDEEISNFDKVLLSSTNYYATQTVGTKLEIGYQISNSTGKDFLSQIDLQPINDVTYQTYYNTATDIEIYVNENSDDLSAATTYVGSFDISSGVNKIQLSSPILVGEEFAIKIAIKDSKIISGYADRNSQRFVANYYSNGAWSPKYYDENNYNLVITPFYLRTIMSDEFEYSISKEDNTQFVEDKQTVYFKTSFETGIADTEVEIYRRKSIDIFYDSFDFVNEEVSSLFDITKSATGFSVTPKTNTAGEFKIVATVNGEKQFIKFLKVYDEIYVSTAFADYKDDYYLYALRVHDSSLTADEVSVTIPTYYSIGYESTDGKSLKLEEMFKFDSSVIAASANYEYDEFERIISAEITFEHLTLHTTRTITFNFVYEAKCKIIYVTHLPTATHSNPEFVANGATTNLLPATAPNYEFLGWYTDETFTDRRDKFTPLVDGAIIQFFALFEQKGPYNFVESVEYDTNTEIFTISLDFTNYDLSIFDAIKFSSIEHKFSETVEAVDFYANINSTYSYQIFVPQENLASSNEVTFTVTIMRYAFEGQGIRNTQISQDVSAVYSVRDVYLSFTTVGSGQILNANDILTSYSGDVAFPYNSNLLLKFVPEEYYYIYDVIVDGVSKGASETFNLGRLTDDHTVVVVFKPFEYTISISHQGKGLVRGKSTFSANGTEYVSAGETVSYSFVSATGNYISKLVIDGVEIDSPGASYTYEFKNIKENHTIVVEFSTYVYTITVTEDDNTFIEYVNYGDNFTFNFIQKQGYYIDKIMIDGEVVENTLSSYTFENIDKNHTIIVVYKVQKFTITIEFDAPATLEIYNNKNETLIATLTESGEVVVDYGTDLKYQLILQNGYYLDSMYIDSRFAGKEIDKVQTNITENHTVEFDIEIYEYEITVKYFRDGKLYRTDETTEQYGGSLTIDFNPGINYKVEKVIVNGENKADISSYRINFVYEDIVVEAYYAIKTYLIYWYDCDGDGYTSTVVKHGSFPVNNVEPSKPATTEHTYKFIGWNSKLDGSGTGIVPATGTASYYPQFKEVLRQFDISITVSGNGKALPSNLVKVDYLTNQIITIEPDSGYHISRLYIDRLEVEPVSTYTFESVNKNHTIFVEFKKNDFAATIENNDEFGSIVGGEWFELGERAKYTVLAKEGYEVKSVYVNGNKVTVSNDTFIIEKVLTDLEIVVEYESTKKSSGIKNLISNVIYMAVGLTVLSAIVLVAKIIKIKRQKKIEEAVREAVEYEENHR